MVLVRWYICRIPMVGYGYMPAIHDDATLIAFNIFFIHPHYRVIFQQMRQSPIVGQIVDGHDFHIRKGLILAQCSEDISADIPNDRYADRRGYHPAG